MSELASIRFFCPQKRTSGDALMQGVSDFSEGIGEPPIVGAELQETL